MSWLYSLIQNKAIPKAVRRPDLANLKDMAKYLLVAD